MAEPLLLQVLKGRRTTPPPIWLMRQAGRYLPEYRAVRAEAGGFLDLVMDPPRAAEVTLQPVRRFGLDAAILFSDILVLPWALGQDLRFAEGEGPLLGPLDIARLNQEEAPARWAPVIETVTRVVAALPKGVPLIGFAGSPLTVAAYMIDGRGGDFARTRAMIAASDPALDRLLATLVEASITYLSAQIKAGASTVQLFESHGALADTATLERLVLAPTRGIVTALRARHPGLPIIGFPRGLGAHLAAYGAGTGVECVGIDTATSLRAADQALPPGTAMQGNLDPTKLVAGGEVMSEAVCKVLRESGSRPLVFNLGHGITPDTPPDHVAALVAAVRRAT